MFGGKKVPLNLHVNDVIGLGLLLYGCMDFHEYALAGFIDTVLQWLKRVNPGGVEKKIFILKEMIIE